MIVGIGVDVVDVPRFEATLARTPRLLSRLFAPAERVLKPRSLAARYAAKEALIKALGGSDGVHWVDIEIRSEASGRPMFSLGGETADSVAARGITALHLSMSHDAGLATAYVIAESGPVGAPTGGATSPAPGAAAPATALPPEPAGPDTGASPGATGAAPAGESASLPETTREDTA